VPEARYTGGITPDIYQHPDIICSRATTPGGTHTKIAAGQTIELFWMAFDRTHHGPVITYLANCHGPCETVDKTTLEFFKIEEVGLITPEVPVRPGFPVALGYWAADKLDDDNNTWTVTIPPTIAPGNYVLRYERVALYNASGIDDAQNYPNCINLEITGKWRRQSTWDSCDAVLPCDGSGPVDFDFRAA
jgi:cellulase